MKIKFIAILCFLALTIPAYAEHIRSDGMGGFYTDNSHVRSDGIQQQKQHRMIYVALFVLKCVHIHISLLLILNFNLCTLN